MRKGLFLSALLATVLVGGTALAERNETDQKPSRGQQIKEQVLEKQRDGFSKSSTRTQASRQDKNTSKLKNERVRPRGEIYGDQGTRGGQKGATISHVAQSAGHVNTPSEIRKMRQMINPMYGAYRMAAGDAAESYGGEAMVPNGKGQGAGSKNMTATGRVNTPSEIRAMMQMINPMYGAYRMAAGDACESYGGRSMTPQGYHTGGASQSAVTRHVHFKNDKGEVMGATQGNTATAMKNEKLKNEIVGVLKSKMAEKANIAGK